MAVGTRIGVTSENGLPDPVATAFPVAAPVRMLPVHVLRDHVPFRLAIEQQRAGVTKPVRVREHLAGGFAREQAARHRVSVQGPLDGAVRGDQRDATGQHLRHRPGERKAAPGDEHDLDAGVEGGLHRDNVGLRNPAATVEQCAVDVDRDEPHVHDRQC